ncbi:Golgin subfamily A member 7/ERF4 family-domain-containing protein, partial [Hysterangium stoloniferum]
PKPPHSSYYIGPPSNMSAYGTPPCGQMGVHHPREIVRIERDYDHGELVQFSSAYPLEIQGRITPTQFLETINALNEGLIRAHSVRAAALYNVLAVLTLWISPLFLESRYDKEMGRLQQLVDVLNAELYNPQGLNILWPRKSAFLFVSL